MEQQPQLKIDIKASTPLLSPEGNHLFAEGVILRKLSKFAAGTAEDVLIPIPVYYDIKTGNILTELLPRELREEYEQLNNNNGSKEERIFYPSK